MHLAPHAPAVDEFPEHSAAWYLVARSDQVTRRPSTWNVAGKKLVAYRTTTGAVALLDARCCHLGADLGQGVVRGDVIQCPFHNWEFDPGGRCVRIPAQDDIPEFARQGRYPTAERHGNVFFFRGPAAAFDLPFFPGCDPADFVSAPPFDTTLDCPWFLVGANAFDLQHFRAAHDRRLAAPPVVETPTPFARRATGTFVVAGDTMQDRLTRLFAGDRVTMSITDWCGSMMFATAKFRRTCSYGMVLTEALGPTTTKVRVVVFVPKSRGALRRALVDPVHGWIRRAFIRAFLSADAQRLNGTRYNPRSLIAADRDMAEYFTWLAAASTGHPTALAAAEPILGGDRSCDTSYCSESCSP